MSKKKFKKFKKKKHSKHPFYVAPKPAQAEVQQTAETLKETADVEKPEQAAAEMEIEQETAEEKEEYGYVKKDVKKILIVIGSIFVLLFIAYYANLKTPLFHSMGDWLYNKLNIQTQ